MASRGHKSGGRSTDGHCHPTGLRQMSQAGKTRRGDSSSPSRIPGRREATDCQAKAWAEEALVALQHAFIRASTRPRIGATDRSLFIERYAKRLQSGTAVSWLKFHLAYIFAYAVDQSELPTPPKTKDGSILWEGETAGRPVGGDMGRALQKLMARGKTGNWACRRVCFDILMSKLGMPVVPETFVSQALKDHGEVLGQPVQEPDPYRNYVARRVEEAIDVICDDVFGKATFGPLKDPEGSVFHHRDMIPSLRACHETKLTEGGALGELFHSFLSSPAEADRIDKRVDAGLVAIQAALEGGVLLGTELLSMTEKKPGQVESFYAPAHFDETVEQFQDFVDQTWFQRLDEPLDCEPCAILEPLKVRIITKGQAAEYYRSLELQRFIHGSMRRHPVFQYIGQPIDDESFRACFGCKEDLKDNEFYVSGDYKAATDNLDPRMSLYAWESICRRAVIWQTEVGTLHEEGSDFDLTGVGRFVRLSETPYMALGSKALCRHLLHYAEGRNVDQTWGQLMGSPLSFPILCLVNAAASCVALETRFSKTLRMKVNGDDIAFVATTEQYETWKSVTACCGLQFSLGKNYTSREFIIMNSELRRPPSNGKVLARVERGYEGEPDVRTREEWVSTKNLETGHVAWEVVTYEVGGDWRLDFEFVEVDIPWRLEGFFNQSVAYKRIKKGVHAGAEKDVYWTELQSLSNELLRGISVEHQDRFMGVFMHSYEAVIAEVPPYANIFFPLALGGVGMAIPGGLTLSERLGLDVHGPSFKERHPERLEAQQKQAAYLACNPVKRIKRPTVRRPITGLIGKAFESVISYSSSQVAPLLRPKPRMRTQGTIRLGGALMLGLLIRALSTVALDFLKLKGSSKDLGGDVSSEVYDERQHRKLNADLYRQYQHWVGTASRSKLTPMRLDNITRFQEHLGMYQYVELVQTRPTTRALG